MAQEEVPTQPPFERWFEVEVVQPMADFQGCGRPCSGSCGSGCDVVIVFLP